MADAFIIDGVRIPRSIGKVGKGALAHMLPQHLAATVLTAIRIRNDFDTADVDDVIWGVSAQYGLQGNDMGRMAALDAGYDRRVSGVTLDRFCGSGLTASNLAAGQIMSGMENLIVAGGTEMWSYINSYAQELQSKGMTRSGPHSINPRLQRKYPQANQGVCADAIASLEGITREELDAFSLESQRRAAKAIAQGRFAKSTVPVIDDDGNIVLDREEYPRPDTNMAQLAELKLAFAALADMPAMPNGVTHRQLINQVYPDLNIEAFHHAGNSSGVVDGAAALLFASGDYARMHALKPRARIVATANVGDCPTLMLNAPTPAAKKVLAKAGLSINDIDVWEVNEAFAVVTEKMIRDLDIDRAKFNINGGAIALGHPIGASGPILIGTALDELERSGGRYGLITMCAAGGMAPAMIIERV